MEFVLSCSIPPGAVAVRGFGGRRWSRAVRPFARSGRGSGVEGASNHGRASPVRGTQHQGTVSRRNFYFNMTANAAELKKAS